MIGSLAVGSIAYRFIIDRGFNGHELFIDITCVISGGGGGGGGDV